MIKFQRGQTLLELVVGMSLITVVIGALAIITTYSLRNSQFSKNQSQGTQLAQENLEKVRTIRSANYGVCLNGQSVCSTWDEIWPVVFGSDTFVLQPCTAAGILKPFCLTYSAVRADLGNGFSGQIIIEDEPGSPATQKRVTSRVFWTDNTGEHSSDLVTVFSKL